jgi:hypothetical protein
MFGSSCISQYAQYATAGAAFFLAYSVSFALVTHLSLLFVAHM